MKTQRDPSLITYASSVPGTLEAFSRAGLLEAAVWCCGAGRLSSRELVSVDCLLRLMDRMGKARLKGGPSQAEERMVSGANGASCCHY